MVNLTDRNVSFPADTRGIKVTWWNPLTWLNGLKMGKLDVSPDADHAEVLEQIIEHDVSVGAKPLTSDDLPDGESFVVQNGVVKQKRSVTDPDTGESYVAHYEDGALKSIRNKDGKHAKCSDTLWKVLRTEVEQDLKREEKEASAAAEYQHGDASVSRGNSKSIEEQLEDREAKKRSKVSFQLKNAFSNVASSVKDRAMSLVTGDEKLKAWKTFGADLGNGAVVWGSRAVVGGLGATAGFTASAGILSAAGIAAASGVAGAGATGLYNYIRTLNKYKTEEGRAELEALWAEKGLAYNTWSDEEYAQQRRLAARQVAYKKAAISAAFFGGGAAIGFIAEHFIPEQVKESIAEKLMNSSALKSIASIFGLFNLGATPEITPPVVKVPEVEPPVVEDHLDVGQPEKADFVGAEGQVDGLEVVDPVAEIHSELPDTVVTSETVVDSPVDEPAVDDVSVSNEGGVADIEGYADLAEWEKLNLAYEAVQIGDDALAIEIMRDVGRAFPGPGAEEWAAERGVFDAPAAEPPSDIEVPENTVDYANMSDAEKVATYEKAFAEGDAETIKAMAAVGPEKGYSQALKTDMYWQYNGLEGYAGDATDRAAVRETALTAGFGWAGAEDLFDGWKAEANTVNLYDGVQVEIFDETLPIADAPEVPVADIPVVSNISDYRDFIFEESRNNDWYVSSEMTEADLENLLDSRMSALTDAYPDMSTGDLQIIVGEQREQIFTGWQDAKDHAALLNAAQPLSEAATLDTASREQISRQVADITAKALEEAALADPVTVDDAILGDGLSPSFNAVGSASFDPSSGLLKPELINGNNPLDIPMAPGEGIAVRVEMPNGAIQVVEVSNPHDVVLSGSDFKRLVLEPAMGDVLSEIRMEEIRLAQLGDDDVRGALENALP